MFSPFFTCSFSWSSKNGGHSKRSPDTAKGLNLCLEVAYGICVTWFFDLQRIQSQCIEFIEGEGFWRWGFLLSQLMFDVIRCPGLGLQTVADCCRLLQTVVDCRRFGQLRHQDMSSVGARLAAKDSLGLQSGLRGWQRLPVNSFQAARRARRSARSWSWNTGTDWNAGTPWTISDDFGLALSCQERCGWRFIPQGSKKGSGSISAIGLTQSLKQHQPENGEQNHQILIKIIEYVNICKYFIQNQYSSIFINIQYPTYFSVFNAFFEPRISMFFFQIWSNLVNMRCAEGYEPLLRAVYERGPVGVSVAARTWWLLSKRRRRRSNEHWNGETESVKRTVNRTVKTLTLTVTSVTLTMLNRNWTAI